MVDGAATLMAMFFTFRATGFWPTSAAPTCSTAARTSTTCYETSDGKHICDRLDRAAVLRAVRRKGRSRRASGSSRRWIAKQWPALKDELTRVFKTKTQAQWCEIMEGTDVCFAPVLSIFEAPDHPHNVARNSFVERRRRRSARAGAALQPHESRISHGARRPGEDSESVLKDCGFSAQEIKSLQTAGIVPAA